MLKQVVHILTIACCRVNYVYVQLEVNFTYNRLRSSFYVAPAVNSNATHTNATTEHYTFFHYYFSTTCSGRSFDHRQVEDRVRPKHVVEK